MDSVLLDFTVAMRAIRRAPVYALTFVIVVGVVIGIAGAFINLAVGLRQHYDTLDDADRLSRLSSTISLSGATTSAAIPMLERSGLFDGVLGYAARPLPVSHGSVAPTPAVVELVTHDYFRVLGIHVVHGRPWTQAEATAGDPVLVISDRAWRQWFQSTSSALGERLTVDGRLYTIVGVAPPGFGGLQAAGIIESVAWIPARAFAAEGGAPVAAMNVVARLDPSVSMDAIARLLTSRLDASGVSSRFDVHPLATGWFHPSIDHIAVPTAIFLLTAALAIVVIGCVNVATLTMARAQARLGESRTRVALGASRAQVMRPVAIEIGALCFSAFMVGMWFAASAPWLLNRLGTSPDVGISFSFDGRFDLWLVTYIALLSAAAAALVVTLSFSPLRRATGAAASGRAGNRKRHGLNFAVTWQTLVSALLLFLVSFLLRSWVAFSGQAVDGSVSETLGVSLKWANEEDVREQVVGLARTVASLPNVEGVGIVDCLPWGQSTRAAWASSATDSVSPLRVAVSRVDRAALSVMGVANGRESSALAFTDSRDALISRTLAARLWPGRPPDGEKLRVQAAEDRNGSASDDVLARVAGIVDDTPGGGDGALVVYRPYDAPTGDSAMLVVRAAPGTASAAERMLLDLLRSRSPGIAVTRIAPLADSLRDGSAIYVTKIGSSLLSFLAVVGVAMTLCGVYGLVAVTIQERMRDTAVRVALGARLGSVVYSTAGFVIRSVVVGVTVAVVFFRIAVSMGNALIPRLGDPTVSDAAVGGGALLVTGIAAAMVPALRAYRLNVWHILKS